MTEAGFLETLERVEAVHSILKRMEDIDCVLDKITVIEEFINRFGTLEALIARFEEVEKQLYILKEIFNVEEAAKYLNISTGHLYRLTSTHEIPFSKPNGKPKSKKTFNCAAIVASALSGKNILHYKAHLPEGKHKVLYVDTEQSKCHCHKVLERILKLAGMPTDRETDRLVFFMLREYSPKQRRQIINHALSADPEIGFVVIDGIRDLMYDINSPSESVDLINDLMRWSSMHDLHIHTVLHLNKGDDNTRGHIGTELNNKAETILQVTKSQFDGNISEVKAMHIREREFQPFAFRINREALPELVEDYAFTQERKPTTEVITDAQHAKALEIAFGNGPIVGYGLLIKSLRQGYAEIGFKRGRNICIELNKYLMGRGVIVKNDKAYAYQPEALNNGDDTAPKEV